MAEPSLDSDFEVPDEIRELIPLYLANRGEDLGEMNQSLAGRDFDRLAALAHNIKGTGRSYGLPAISGIGAALEVCAKRADAAGCEAQVVELAGFLERVRSGIY